MVVDGRQPRRIDVPVEVPEGVNRQTAYGEETERLSLSSPRQFAQPMARRAMIMANSPPSATLNAVPNNLPSATPVPSYVAGAGSGGGFVAGDVAIRQPISGAC
jgi:hypothetical protein